MTNDEARLTKCSRRVLFDIRHSVIHSSFVIRHSSFSVRRAFTLIELLVVIAIIIVLAGLVLSTVGYVQKKGARSRAETEIAAISAACESYKADNGVYPYDPSTTSLDARTMFDSNSTSYQSASLALYKFLSADENANRTIEPTEANRVYFSFKPNMLLPAPPSTADIIAIRDPFGNSYGYSTIANPTANPSPSPGVGYNPTFDLWSTAGLGPSPTPAPPAVQQDLWIKNW